jgi:hypothetical protein
VLLILSGFFIGGLISFVRTQRWILAVAMAGATVLSLVGVVLWWDPA